MHAWLWKNGEFCECDSLPVSDRGFRYGMSLFETVRIHNNRAILLQAHLEQLCRSCEDRGFPVDPKALEESGDLLSRQANGVGRIYVTAGDGGPFAERVEQTRVLVIAEDRQAPQLAPCGVSLTEEVYHPPFGGLKTGNYWRNIDALHLARRAGFDETLLFNEHSELVSGAMSNVFLVHDGQVHTPTLECGARTGVMRTWVKEQLTVRECSLFFEDLQQAEAVFLTNSWYGIRPVTKLGTRVLPSSSVGENLVAKFTALLEGR